jgi:predicted ATPase
MFTHMTIDNLRGVKRLVVDGLKRVNVIVGRNNTAKTSLLEAIFLLSGGATNAWVPSLIGRLRGQTLGRGGPDAVWRPLFHDMDPRMAIEIRGMWSDEPNTRRLRIEAGLEISYSDASFDEQGVVAATQDLMINKLSLRYTSATGEVISTQAKYDEHTGVISPGSERRDDFIRSTFLSARSYPTIARDADQFSHLVRIKQEQDVLDAMKVIEPRIQGIKVATDVTGPSVDIDIGLNSLIPLAACGEGFVRLFSVIVELTGVRHGILLIDEVDNGLHHSVMDRLWEKLGALCEKHQVQVFATTHNEEMIHSALRAFQGRPGELGLFRIDRRNNEHSIASYDREAQEAVLQERFEVRG